MSADCPFCTWKNPQTERKSVFDEIIHEHYLTNHLLEHLIKEEKER